MIVYSFEWTFIVNLGGTAEVKSFCPFLFGRDKGFFYSIKKEIEKTCQKEDLEFMVVSTFQKH